MKLQQLRYLVAVVDHGYNITAASEALFTSQPGVSKQIRLLEDELSLQIFVRRGKSLTGLTEAGRRVVERARRMLAEADYIKQLSSELAGEQGGELTIATTPTQARYVLPELLHAFQRSYPDIALRLHQGTSEQIAEQVLGREADFAVASGRDAMFEDLVTLPLFSWERVVVVPRDHELAALPRPGLEDIARHPIISYTYSFSEESSLGRVFGRAGVEPNVVFTAQDPDVIKDAVRRGMGIGVLACMAVEAGRDDDLVVLPTKGLFPVLTTWIGFRRDRFLRDYMLEFLQRVVPGATPATIAEAVAADPAADRSTDAGDGTVVPFRPPRPLQAHPVFGSRFAECCGGFNL